MRCPATFEAWNDPVTWETLKPQPSVASAVDGKPIKPHTGSIAWNPWRKRWVTVFMQAFGKPSALGELWYAEADAPTGPWGKAVKVLTHENYTFYNPRLHPEFTPPILRCSFSKGPTRRNLPITPRRRLGTTTIRSSTGSTSMIPRSRQPKADSHESSKHSDNPQGEDGADDGEEETRGVNHLSGGRSGEEACDEAADDRPDNSEEGGFDETHMGSHQMFRDKTGKKAEDN